jgi:hypothetical protein
VTQETAYDEAVRLVERALTLRVTRSSPGQGSYESWADWDKQADEFLRRPRPAAGSASREADPAERLREHGEKFNASMRAARDTLDRAAGEAVRKGQKTVVPRPEPKASPGTPPPQPPSSGFTVFDLVNFPEHYQGPNGTECIDVTETMSFCRGNAMKYLWRAGRKGDEVQDLEKAAWYLQREIARLKGDGRAPP